MIAIRDCFLTAKLSVKGAFFDAWPFITLSRAVDFLQEIRVVAKFKFEKSPLDSSLLSRLIEGCWVCKDLSDSQKNRTRDAERMKRHGQKMARFYKTKDKREADECEMILLDQDIKAYYEISSIQMDLAQKHRVLFL